LELIYQPGFAKAGNLLLDYATTFFKKQKTDAILAWCFRHSLNYDRYKKSGYFNLPEKLRPQHLFLGVRSFNHNNQHFTENKKNWYISYSDSDTV
jgi:hypothetical protein